MKTNYQKKCDQVLESLEGSAPALLLHSCCAPCSSYVLEYLSAHFQITIYYYNPNITDAKEYQRRLSEQERLIGLLDAKNPIRLVAGDYQPEVFLQATAGMEDLPEGGARCHICYALRMEQAAQIAKENGFDYFTTTLSISPHKDAQKLNEIGESLSAKYDIPYLYADFKKKGGYQRSIELSKQFGLYRQDFCGCQNSKRVD